MAIRTAPPPTGGDDTNLLNTWIAGAAAGDYNSAAPGSVYKHSGEILFRDRPNTMWELTGVRFESTSVSGPVTVWLNNAGIKIKGLHHKCTNTSTTRLDQAFQNAGFSVNSNSGVTMENCISEGFKGVGWYLWNTTGFTLTNCQTRTSLADGINMTNGSSGTLTDFFSSNAGDDGMSCIGYWTDGDAGRPHDISNVRPVVRNARARGLSYIGAVNCTATDVDIDGTLAGAIMFASEHGDFNTRNTSGCRVTRGRISRANTAYTPIPNGTTGTAINHGAVVWTANTSTTGPAANVVGTVTDCTVSGLTVGSFGPGAGAIMRYLNYGGSIVGCGFSGLIICAGSPSTVIDGTSGALTAFSPRTFTETRSATVPAPRSDPGMPTTPTAGGRKIRQGGAWVPDRTRRNAAWTTIKERRGGVWT